MLDHLDASHDRLRLAVARALRNYTTSELLDCCRDCNPIVRTTAARELQVRGSAEIFEAAKELIRHPRHDYREIGAFILGQLGTPACRFSEESLKLLGEALDDVYYEVKAATIRAIGSLASLGKQPPDELTRRVASKVSHDAPSVREAVAFCLGMIHSEVALNGLRSMSAETDPLVEDMVALAIELHTDRLRR